MNPMLLAGFLFATLLATADANTEKTIFVAPPPTTTPDAGPSFDNLNLFSLSPLQLSLRLPLPVAFPSDEQPRGIDSWYLLQGLTEAQRYEVRICWAAVQPTTFCLDVYNITHVFDTPDLITSLAVYSEARVRQHLPDTEDTVSADKQSVLFLRVQSAADFFTTNTTLMNSPPDVNVDIILDPYLANIFPQSLVPTGGYIIVLAIGSWLLSGIIWKRLFSGPKQHVD
ncbi:hypothetical protein LTR36_000191 [Oleoguttula mirabilis]|uniref:Uncharacterized protein n=1 Tax=Oleoguttula mirabilis TaxID=1507867 RepID=A0AAV9JZW5_9PEZI|nr:hypothetical protein LTR36_000191 [Oleoguttula mirabilis]